MHEYTPEAAQAIESRSRQLTHKLMVDWYNNGLYQHPLSDMSQYVTRTSRDQAISSTAPDELMLIEGYGSASLEIEVAGKFRGVPLTGHFAPYNGRSVFYTEGISLGVEMYYDIAVWTGSGWEWYRQFTGVVREVEALRKEGIVKIDCLDNIEKLRTSVSIPAYGVQTGHLEKGAKRGGLVDSSSIIDLAARTGGFTMGPRPGMNQNDNHDPNRATVFSAPMHGSTLPELGMFDNYQEVHQTEAWEDDPNLDYRSEAFRGGPHGYLALNAVPKGQEGYAHKTYWVTEETSAGFSMWNTHMLGCWLFWEGPDASADSTVISLRLQKHKFQLIVEGSNAGVNARIVRDDGAIYDGTWMTMQPGWNYIEAGFDHFDRDGTHRVKTRTRVNDDTSAITTTYGAGLTFFNDVLSGLVEVQNRYAISDVEIHHSAWGLDLQNCYKDITLADNADVSWGRNRMTHTMRDSNTPAWELAKEVAAAEYGVVWFDEFGKFRFWNFNDVTNKQSTIARKFDLNDVEGLAMRTTMDSVRNKWNVVTQAGQARSGIFYDLNSEATAWTTPTNRVGLVVDELIPRSLAKIPDAGALFYFLRATDNLMSPDPFDVGDVGEFGEWEQNVPHHGCKIYRGNSYLGDAAAPYANPETLSTEQKWIGNEWVRISLLNRMDDGGAIGFVLESKDSGRFRVGGTMVYEDAEQTWSIVDQDSIDTYGTRTIELKSDRWLQDRFQTENMLEAVVAKFSRPTPVTDDITVAGDPRVQIGDVIEINDWEGMGERIRLQIYGIKRELQDGAGLTDTYKVEVIETPGEWILGSASYSVLGQSTILA